jgi:hypothetical protein
VIISRDGEIWKDEGMVQPHQTATGEYPNDDVKVWICPDCIGMVFLHLAEKKPEGTLDGLHRDDEQRMLTAISALKEYWFGEIRLEDGDEMKFLETLVGCRINVSFDN